MRCMHNRRTTCGGSAIPSRAGRRVLGCGRLTLHAAVEGAGGVLDWCLVISLVVRLFFVDEGLTGVCRSMISLEEKAFRTGGEGLKIYGGVANGNSVRLIFASD